MAQPPAEKRAGTNSAANRFPVGRPSPAAPNIPVNQPVLLVLAAGLGSRYGGLKQVDPVGPSGETLLDYSVHDACRAGFGGVVFVIRREMEAEFRRAVGARYDGKIRVDYAWQDLADLPDGFAAPAERAKPWGTAHAIWCARGAISGPFASINADDFYGASAFREIARFLQSAGRPVSPPCFAMAGYRLDKTLSEHGTVARACCRTDANTMLRTIEEMTDIARQEDGTITGGGRVLAAETPVSMNFWGFTPEIFPLLEKSLSGFLAARAAEPKAEHYIPSAVAEMIAEGRAGVRVLPVEAGWFGVTYREDKPRVVENIRRLVAAGDYPEKL